jgi:hypothetical protein
MTKLLLAFAALVAVLLTADSAAAAAAQTPEQFLRAIYDGYTSPSPSNGQGEEDNVRTRRIYAPDLAEMIVADYRKMQDMPGEPVLEFDPLVNAQAIEITGRIDIKVTQIAAEQGKPERATAVVTFTNSGKRERLTYKLVRLNGQWKIDDIDWNGRQTLRGLFRK